MNSPTEHKKHNIEKVAAKVKKKVKDNLIVRLMCVFENKGLIEGPHC